MIKLRRGDIIGFYGKPLERALCRLIDPYSPLWHFALLGDSDGEDWGIYEMLGGGCHPGKLSFYEGSKVRIYRCPDAKVARKAVKEASNYGRYPYDYIMFPKLFFKALYYWLYNGFVPVPFKYFDNVENNQLICTELIANCYYNAGYPLVSDGIVPTPAAIEQAVINSDLKLVYEGLL